MIEVVQKYNTEMYKKAMRVLLGRQRWSMLIFGLIILGFSVAFYFDSIGYGITFSVLGVAITSFYFILPMIAMKANKRNEGLKQVFKFSQDSVRIDIYNVTAGENNAICIATYNNDYKTFYDVKEIDGVVYFFLNKTTAFLIDSRNFPTDADKLMVIGYYRANKHNAAKSFFKK